MLFSSFVSLAVTRRESYAMCFRQKTNDSGASSERFPAVPWHLDDIKMKFSPLLSLSREREEGEGEWFSF